MDDALQRLLEAERHAEEISQQASEEKDRAIEEALAEAKHNEALFQARIPELRATFLDKATERAQRTVGELQKRFDERHCQLRRQAEEREAEAVQAALRVITDPTC